MRILITRHGESMYNTEDRIGGNPQLSCNGILYAQRLKEFCKNEDIPKKLISSTLQRAVQTASHSQQYFESWQKIPLLNEINAGDMEDLTYTEFKERFPEEYAKRKEDKFSYQYPNGESYKDLIDRTKPVVEFIRDGGEDVFIVCHRAIVRALLFHLVGVRKKDIPHIEIPLHHIISLNGEIGEMSMELRSV